MNLRRARKLALALPVIAAVGLAAACSSSSSSSPPPAAATSAAGSSAAATAASSGAAASGIVTGALLLASVFVPNAGRWLRRLAPARRLTPAP